MINDDKSSGDDSADELIRREYQAARLEVNEVRQHEDILRKDVAERATSHIAELDQAARVASEHLETDHDDHVKKLASLKQRLDACVASGDNDGALALISEISLMEAGG